MQPGPVSELRHGPICLRGGNPGRGWLQRHWRVVEEGLFVADLYGITEEVFASCIPEGGKLSVHCLLCYLG